MVTLVPMTAETFERWHTAAIRGYAGDKSRVGAWPADEALQRSERAFAELLPDGQATVNHEFRSIVDETGTVVGSLWFGPVANLGAGSCFIWDFEIAPEARGRGLGRAALQALEPVARELGYETIGLHVFGDNEIARNLYRSAGYIETDVQMRKSLG